MKTKEEKIKSLIHYITTGNDISKQLMDNIKKQAIHIILLFVISQISLILGQTFVSVCMITLIAILSYILKRNFVSLCKNESFNEILRTELNNKLGYTSEYKALYPNLISKEFVEKMNFLK
jgi:hypothetical protein